MNSIKMLLLTTIPTNSIILMAGIIPPKTSFLQGYAAVKKIQAGCHSSQMSTQPMQIASSASNSAPPNSGSGFKILKEELCYSRYLNVYNRIVEYPPREETAADSGSSKGKIVQYDIVGSKTVSFHFCAVFPYDSLTRSVTLIKEYAQGGNCYMYGVPCGGLSEKHSSLEDCARKELSEEAQLKGGNLVKLISDDHPGLLEVKWCRNRFTPFILLNPEKDAMPCPMDPEEVIEVLTVDIPTLKEIMYGGSMMLPSVVTCSMALKYLRDHDFLNSD